MAETPNAAESLNEGAQAAGSQGRRKTETGRVVSNKMDKTVVVAVERRYLHPLYKKFVKRTKKYYADDQQNACNVGDVVRIIETRPLSRLKRWRVGAILRKAR